MENTYIKQEIQIGKLENILLNKPFWSAVDMSQKSLDFLKKFNIPSFFEKIKVAMSSQELLESYFLRSDTYKNLNYDDEFKGNQENLEFDKFDEFSLTIINKEKSKIYGMGRLIFDNQHGLPSEKYCDLSDLREQNKQIAEISRMIIIPEKQKGPLLLQMSEVIYQLGFINGISEFIFSVIDEHIDLYKRFGGIKILAKGLNYGGMPKLVSILHWDTNQLNPKYSKRFNRPFLQ